MRLISMRLQNFRQHEDTNITFERGLTGIIGLNGAGKSTILEAIAWSLYGNSAARGTRDSIRFSGAKARASVRVQLEFELAGHRYRVVRGLTSAECFLDGADSPIASTLSGVSELLQRRLGMTRSEFFHTYFTGQKELDVMAALGPVERARFLSRVLGYDKLSGAQELVREKRRALVAEANGLKQGMPDADSISRQLSEAQSRLVAARSRSQEAEKSQRETEEQLEHWAPRWIDAQAERERGNQLSTEMRVVENEVASALREVQRLDHERAEIDVAQKEVAPLMPMLIALPALREQLSAQDALAGAESKRQTLLERLRSGAEEEGKLAEREVQLETAPQLEREASASLATQRNALAEVERELDDARTAWTRDKQEAETRLEALRTQYAELEDQRGKLEGLGEESPCPTCGRPLGKSYRSVLDLLTEQISTMKVDGDYYRQRGKQLMRIPDNVEKLEERRKTAQQELAASERRYLKIQNAVAELGTLFEQRTKVTGRLEETRQALTALPTGYDAGRHSSLRGDVAQLGEIERRVARLSGLVERDAPVRVDQERAREKLGRTRERIASLQTLRDTLRIDEAAYLIVREQHERVATLARQVALEAVVAQGDVARAQSELANGENRRLELVKLVARLAELENDKRLHDELDRTYTDLRTDLNTQLRPELAEIAGGFLRSLTDGRYSALEFDDDYNVIVLENELPKQVVSGGEEDLCNLVLRLAISQMIAERAGQAFSLLILDEVFGSLDETRRDNVIELLRRLQDRFEQVIVITHIEQVREGLDRVLVVRYNEQSGAATVTLGGTNIGDEANSDGDDLMRKVS
ncbi:MAG: SMC family ATPase [Gemmatimonadaceae bacterium]